MNELEIWGGHECTVNRVGDRYLDQTVLSGHQQRLEDLDRFAELGLKTLRYPLLWERIAPTSPESCDWSWSDLRMQRLQALNIRPIAGLVHHGAGPDYALLDTDGFAPGLAAFAEKAARRYPWIDAWTPVNEPLTTARFSALYGHWYPHAREEGAFWRVLLNEIDAVRLSMAAIRRINPAAQLVQTEDLGRTYSTREARPQAEFDNGRRWMSFDLLCGRVTPEHPLFGRLERFGLGDRLRRIADDPCPPDVMGVNHYLTSDRFLDHRVGRYPPHTHGGSPLLRYADVEAVRVLEPAPDGVATALREAWSRYRLPVAMTECHNGCTHEEQVRWLRDTVDAARRLRAEGCDIQAVTVWSLLGAYDWHCLLTRNDGCYEPGVFDVRGPEPRPTALAAAVKALTAGAPLTPAAAGPGWWRRPLRLQHPPVRHLGAAAMAPDPAGPPLLITGATGTLGRHLARACEVRGLSFRLLDRREMEITDPASVAAALDRHQPWAVINAAGYVRVDEAEADAAACLGANGDAAGALARACAAREVAFVGVSSDLVFDGTKHEPYVEGDPVAPLNVYGASKAEAEAQVLAAGGRALMVRTAAFFSPHDPYNFAVHVARTLGAGRRLQAAEDWVVSPTFTPDLAQAMLDLLIDGETGLWHLANRGAVSWAAFARQIAEALDLDAGLVDGVEGASLGLAAARPRQAALASSRGAVMRSLEAAVAEFAAAWRAESGVAAAA